MTDASRERGEPRPGPDRLQPDAYLEHAAAVDEPDETAEDPERDGDREVEQGDDRRRREVQDRRDRLAAELRVDDPARCPRREPRDDLRPADAHRLRADELGSEQRTDRCRAEERTECACDAGVRERAHLLARHRQPVGHPCADGAVEVDERRLRPDDGARPQRRQGVGDRRRAGAGSGSGPPGRTRPRRGPCPPAARARRRPRASRGWSSRPRRRWPRAPAAPRRAPRAARATGARCRSGLRRRTATWRTPRGCRR